MVYSLLLFSRSFLFLFVIFIYYVGVLYSNCSLFHSTSLIIPVISTVFIHFEDLRFLWHGILYWFFIVRFVSCCCCYLLLSLLLYYCFKCSISSFISPSYSFITDYNSFHSIILYRSILIHSLIRSSRWIPTTPSSRCPTVLQLRFREWPQ